MPLNGDPRYLSTWGSTHPSCPQVQAFTCLGNGLEQCKEPQGARSAVHAVTDR